MKMQRVTSSTILSFALGMSTVATGNDGKWQWAVSPYLWAADIEVAVKD